MKVSTVRRIASQRLKVGESRIWIDSNSLEEIADAATRSDVQSLINRHVIQVKPKKGNSNFRLKKRIRQLSKNRRRGPGSLKGTKYARLPRKRRWIMVIRPLRQELRELREKGEIDAKTYRTAYRFIKGGTIRSRAQLRSHLKTLSTRGESN